MNTHFAFIRHAVLVALSGAALIWAAPASADVDVDIRFGYPYPPPPPRVVYAPPPRVDYVWVPGRWVYYERPRPYWADGYWVHKRDYRGPRHGWDKHRRPPHYHGHGRGRDRDDDD
ncbi:hypothetical protein [Chitinolyticbacter meiyuanensis]|uniref:hypothetical protein n=1 Tax=Chitinolyticbacter meiyuanensis TaxID=682798 RepID=UPI0011E5D7B3|nr:hypothetical protein [Chitinolyticbacter meiyuanensis]